MNHLHVKYLLAGAGAASDAAARAISASDPAGDILLIGQEINRPYHRPDLSKQFLRRQKSREALFTASADWFSQHHVQLRTGRRVAHLDCTRNRAILDSGEEVSFDHLLLAMGASASPLQIPGARLPNLYYLRTLDDAERLQHAVDQAHQTGHKHDNGRGRVIVIGGGLLGVELAGTFAHCGLGVDLIVARDYPLHRYAGEATGKFTLRSLAGAGVVVHVNSRAAAIEGDGRAQHVTLSGGERLDCDFAVAAVGTLIQKEPLRGTPITAERAILVDEHCRTSVPNIYAAGDCAAVMDPLFGKHRLVEHWDGAVETGRIAGLNMAGIDTSYEYVSRFDSQIFDVPMTVWGEGKLVNHRLIRETTRAGAFVEIGVATDGRVAQVIRIGEADDELSLRQLVLRRFPVTGLEERLKGGSLPLSTILG